MSEQKHFVYMLRCADQTLYTGYALNIFDRLEVHNLGKGAKYTRSRLPVALVASWQYDTKREALQAEHRLKRLSRQAKLELIQNGTIYQSSFDYV